MREGWRTLALEEAVSLDIDRVELRPGVSYDLAGVYSFGRGLFSRGRIDSSRTSYRFLQRLRAGQLVMSKLKAWEGAFAVVPPNFDGSVLSPEFPTYTVHLDVVLPEFLRLVVADESFRDVVASKSKGMGGRKERINPRALLDVQIDLPRLAEQRRIVDVAAAVEASCGAAQSVLHRAQRLRTALLARHVASPQSSRTVAVREVCDLVTRGRAPAYVEAGGELVLSQKCVRDGAVDVSVARRTDTRTCPVAEWAWVRPGDTLVNSTGRGTVGRAGFVSGNIRATVDSHVTIVRPDPARVVPAFLGYALFIRKDELEACATGSTNQTELSRDSVASMQVNLPAWAEQIEAVKLLSGVDAYIRSLSQVATTSGRVRERLVSELLCGAHEIPAAYDRLLGEAA
jgi:type I restriction enzyme S subunit